MRDHFTSGFMVYHRLLLYCLIVLIAGSCGGNDTKELIEYKGPLSEGENVELYYSENSKVKIKMLADLVYEFENGDKEFPKGIYVEMYDEFGKLKSTLTANHAYFFKAEDHWRGRGNVEVKNIAKGEQLNTEELFWKPKTRKIFTDKFVTIRQQEDVLYGEGLTANEDLSEYTIAKPSGDMEIQE